MWLTLLPFTPPPRGCYPTAVQNQKCDLYTPSFPLLIFLPASSPIGSLISFESVAAAAASDGNLNRLTGKLTGKILLLFYQ